MKKSTKKAIKGLKKLWDKGLIPKEMTPINTEFPKYVKQFKKLQREKTPKIQNNNSD